MKVHKTKWFARRARILDDSLVEAIERAERGMIDADLGAGLIKRRVARAGQGRSGGYRMLVAYRAQGRAVFLFGFAKNEKESTSPDELASLREISAAWLNADADRIATALDAEELQEVDYGEA